MEHVDASGTNSQRGLMGQARDKAAAQLSSQKDRATDSLGSVANAVRQSSQHLRAQQHDTIAQYVEKAADQLDRFSEHLRNRNLNEIVDDAKRLARRQPAVFIGAAFAAGLIGARFLKSSSDGTPRGAEPYGTPGPVHPSGGSYGSRI